MILTLFLFDMKRFFHSIHKTTVASIMLPTLLLITFGKVVGKVIPLINEIDYTSYISYSLSVITAMIVSTFVTGFEYQADFKGTKNIESLIVSPSKSYEILLGKTLGYGVRGIFTGLFFLFIAYLLGAKIVWGWTIILSIVPLFITGVQFSLISIIVSCLTNTYDEMAALLNIIVFPSMLLSNTFFSLDILPTWAEYFIYFSPVYYNVEILRSICLGSLGYNELILTVISLFYSLIILKVAVFLFNFKMKQ